MLISERWGETGTVRRGFKGQEGEKGSSHFLALAASLQPQALRMGARKHNGLNATPSPRSSSPRALQRNRSVCRRSGTAHGASPGAQGAASSRSSAPVCLPLLSSPPAFASPQAGQGSTATPRHRAAARGAPQLAHLRTPGEATLPSPQKAEKSPLKAGSSVLLPMPSNRSRAAPLDRTATLPRLPPNFSLRSGRTTRVVPTAHLGSRNPTASPCFPPAHRAEVAKTPGGLTWHGVLGYPLGSGLQHLESGSDRAAGGLPRRLGEPRGRQEQQKQRRQRRRSAAP